MALYDTHAHLDYPDYQVDFEAVLQRAESAGVRKIISIGTDLESSRRAVALAAKYSNIYAAVGWHPSYADAAPDDIRAELRALAREPRVVAIGETGMDYSRLPSGSGGSAEEDQRYKAKQARIFEQQLEVAVEVGLNCVIHQREAFEDVMERMRGAAGKVRGVFHCFVNDPASQAAVQAIGSLVSFTGIATFKNAQTIRDTIVSTSLGQFMLETDCPYLAPVPYRGKRCEPAYVREIGELVAKLKGCSIDEVGEATSRTAEEFFPGLAL
ncbi:MAG: TatD family hydrolase [Verrucomicrobiota bacterium]|nr:TatD family hydrolase [Verrucomicrobiota bacterium]